MKHEKRIEEIKFILKGEDYLYKAKAFIDQQVIEDVEKEDLYGIASEILKKNKLDKAKRIQYIGFALCLALAISTFIIFKTFYSSYWKYSDLISTLNRILLGLIPIIAIGISLIAALAMSKEHSYWSRFRSSFVISAGILYLILFLLVMAAIFVDNT